MENGKWKIRNHENQGYLPQDTEEYIFTMKNMKVMKIIHESVNERANGRVHSLTPFFDSFRVLLTLRLVPRLRDAFRG